MRKKVWLESISGYHNAHHYGMSSGLGATTEDLPVDDSVPAGSDAFDYTTKKVYFFDGLAWR